jgi:HK97 family phage major capsid protein/HK97 family phage prohead protease
VNRAYALLHVKSIDADRRIIRGTATTPTPDRTGDVIEPLGASFPPELPLLLHHRKETPVGLARFRKPTKDGIDFEAELPQIAEAGPVKDEVDRAWVSIQHRLIRGVSVGFRVVDDAVEILKSGGLRFLKTEILELSLVTVPANQDATLSVVKSLDAPYLAASGPHLSGVTDLLPVVRAQKGAPVMNTIPEQISAFEATRAARAARMNELMTKAAETGSTLDAAQTEEYDNLDLEVKSVDSHLTRLRELEKANLAAATRVTPTTSSTTASELRGGTSTTPVISIKANVPKGSAFTRMAMALAAGNGDSYKALEIARRKEWDNTPEVELMVKAAVAAGTTTDSTWAGPLAVAQPLVDEFLELLRPKTLIGRIPGFTQVPPNVSVPSQTGGGTYSWVGQGNAKPVTSAAFATVSVPFSKAAGIIVLTKELVRLSSPSAEQLIRTEMIKGMQQFLDVQLIDPAVAVSAGVNPASITNGAATAATFGVTAAFARQDLVRAAMTFTAAELSLSESVWIMNESNALALSIALNALGQPMFPGFTGEGGTLMGAKVIVSNAATTKLILVHAPSILFADEGGVQIDVSQEASVQMDSVPTNPSDATTVLVSFFQRNLVGLRAERMITWIRARTAAVHYTTGVAYTGA